MLAPLTHASFLKHKNLFRHSVLKTPTDATIHVTTVTTSDKFSAFTGDGERSSESKTVKCLYKRVIERSYRMKYALHEGISGLIFIPPDFLIAEFGTYQLDYTKLTVELQGHTYKVDGVLYHSPHYSDCVCVEYRLTDPEKI